MSKNTGIEAFPKYLEKNRDGYEITGGMSLRDYFAAHALQGICASGPSVEFTDDRLASEAYNLADAMMKARK